MSNENRHLMPPRHEFKNFEETGIKTGFPLGRTIITGSFGSNKDPRNEHPTINFSEKENAVWLTYAKTVRGQSYDFIIGPDGEPSLIAILWREEEPKLFMEVKGEMKKIEEIEANDKAEFINTPKYAATSFISKRYLNDPKPGRKLTESYGFMRIQDDPFVFDYRTFKPYITNETLISGMKNRKWLSRSSTSFWAVRVTDISEVPFGRELTGKK